MKKDYAHKRKIKSSISKIVKIKALSFNSYSKTQQHNIFNDSTNRLLTKKQNKEELSFNSRNKNQQHNNFNDSTNRPLTKKAKQSGTQFETMH